MLIRVRGREIECEVEMDGYKVQDIFDHEGTSLLYDYNLSRSEEMNVYTQAERGWMDEQCDHADYLRDRLRDEGP